MEQIIMVSDRDLKSFESKLIKTNEKYNVLKVDTDVQDGVYVVRVFIIVNC